MPRKGKKKKILEFRKAAHAILGRERRKDPPVPPQRKKKKEVQTRRAPCTSRTMAGSWGGKEKPRSPVTGGGGEKGELMNPEQSPGHPTAGLVPSAKKRGREKEKTASSMPCGAAPDGPAKGGLTRMI